MQTSQAKMRARAGRCEHPFGTFKRGLGWDHVLVRGFAKVRGEMALRVQCDNLHPVLTLLGIAAFIAICRQRRQAFQAGPQGTGLSTLFCRLPGRLQRLSAPICGRAIRSLLPARFRSSAPSALLRAA